MNFLRNITLQFAFVVLCEDDSLQESMQIEYVMIDEFQDTNEIV